MHLTNNNRDVAITYGLGDLAPMRTTVSVELVHELLADAGEGTQRYPVCMARQMATSVGPVCDDTSCLDALKRASRGSGSAPGRAGILAVCSTTCNRFPYTCQGAADGVPPGGPVPARVSAAGNGEVPSLPIKSLP